MPAAPSLGAFASYQMISVSIFEYTQHVCSGGQKIELPAPSSSAHRQISLFKQRNFSKRVRC